MDEAAILFSRTFYIAVFASEMGICKAFESAVEVVENKLGGKEA